MSELHLAQLAELQAIHPYLASLRSTCLLSATRCGVQANATDYCFTTTRAFIGSQ